MIRVAHDGRDREVLCKSVGIFRLLGVGMGGKRHDTADQTFGLRNNSIVAGRGRTTWEKKPRGLSEGFCRCM